MSRCELEIQIDITCQENDNANDYDDDISALMH